MAILHTQWWPFRGEFGGGCSLADSVRCDIRKDSFALNTDSVVRLPVWPSVKVKFGCWEVVFFSREMFVLCCSIMRHVPVVQKLLILIIVRAHSEDKAGACTALLSSQTCCHSCLEESMCFLFCSWPIIINSTRACPIKIPSPPCTINDSTVVDMEPNMTSPTLRMTLCVFSHAPPSTPPTHPRLRPVIIWVNGSWSWSKFKWGKRQEGNHHCFPTRMLLSVTVLVHFTNAGSVLTNFWAAAQWLQQIPCLPCRLNTLDPSSSE